MLFNKILSKYIYVGFCFKKIIIRNTMAQSKFNLDVYFVNYRFFKFIVNHNIVIFFIIYLHALVRPEVEETGKRRADSARKKSWRTMWSQLNMMCWNEEAGS